MKLGIKTLRHLAEMVCGSGSGANGFVREGFPYRRSGQLTRFFEDCGLHHVHDGGTRYYWVLNVLENLNAGTPSDQQLPADDLVRVVQELLDHEHFESSGVRATALAAVNEALKREGLEAYLDSAGTAQLHRMGGGADSAALKNKGREWTLEERAKAKRVEEFLDAASEDEFTTDLLVPLLARLGFQRLSIAGHEDKALEYGADLWMKFQLPTGHFLYFGAQVKKGKIDAAGKTKGERSNVTEILNQVRMLVDHPLFDPDVGRKVLVDHVFIVSTGGITKQARNWLVEHLDQAKRRHLIFMDRDEITNLAVSSAMPLPAPTQASSPTPVDEWNIPF